MDTNTVKEIIKKRFVFVSYSGKNFALTNELYNHLIDEGINVVFDEGGLEGGANLRWFEQLILDDNCYCVLMVFDKTYLRKLKKKEGEVWNEYCYVSDHFVDKSEKKCIPVLCDGVKGCDLPNLFKDRDVYDKISEWEKIANDCRDAEDHLNLTITQANYRYDLAEQMHESKDYASCEKILVRIVKNLAKNDETASILAKSYSMLLGMYVNGAIIYDRSVRKSLSALTSLIKEKPICDDKINLPKYALNCSRAYTKNNRHEEAIVFANLALEKARESGFMNLYYYECALSDAFKASKAINMAKEHIEKSYNILDRDYGGRNNDDVLTSIDVHICYAEIMIALARSVRKPRSTLPKKYLDMAHERIDYLESHFEESDFDHKRMMGLFKVKLEYFRAAKRMH